VIAGTLAQIDLALIERLCADRVTESATLDFKRELPAGSSGKDELLKDVCAFANTEGGDLVYGVEEENGEAARIAPLPGDQREAEVRRVLQTIDSNVEPRITGLTHVTVAVLHGYVLIIRVPASFDGPHSYRVNAARSFVLRNGPTTSDMTVDQLRVAFGRTESLVQHAGSFITSRIERLPTLPVKLLQAGPIAVVHFVPLAGVGRARQVALDRVAGTFGNLPHGGWGGSNRDFNLDGLVVYPASDDEGRHSGYTQVFRSGAMEAVENAGGYYADPHHPAHVVWNNSEFFFDRASRFVDSAKKWGYSGPALLAFSLLGVKGHELRLGSWARRPLVSDRRDLVAPPQWIGDIESTDLNAVTRPLLDTLWQGFGVPRCYDFNEAGEYIRPR
jgi:hypothetical protein